MLARPEPDVLEALARLRTSPEWLSVYAWLASSESKLRDELVLKTGDTNEQMRLQGACRLLHYFFKAVEEAPQHLNHARDNLRTMVPARGRIPN